MPEPQVAVKVSPGSDGNYVGCGGAKDAGRLFALWLVFTIPSLDLCGLTGEGPIG